MRYILALFILSYIRVGAQTSCDKYISDYLFFRANGIGLSSDLKTAKRKAKLDASINVAQIINDTFDKTISLYTNSISLNSEKEASFEKIIKECINKELKKPSIKCSKIFQTKDKTYKYIVVVEVSKKKIIRNINSSLSKNNLLRSDYDEIKFDNFLNQQMSILIDNKTNNNKTEDPALTSTSIKQNNKIINDEKKVPTRYDRSSLTVLFADFSGPNWNATKSKIRFIDFSDKYDNNNINELFIKPSLPYFDYKIPNQEIQESIRNELYRTDIARKIIAKWYNRKADGTMEMNLIFQRGRFTSVDQDYLLAQSLKRGNAALEDYGERLINLSYILVIDINSIKSETTSDGQRWYGHAKSFLYRIDFNDNVKNSVYSSWINEDDSEDIRINKRKSFEKLLIPIIPITQTVVYETSNSLQELIQIFYNETLYCLQNNVPEFRILTPIISIRPIKAKIGLKEGLITDTKFYVYEYVWNKKTNKEVPHRRGVVRAQSISKIVDNRYEAKGNMISSEFYQVSGHRLKEGYVIHQQPELGLEIFVGSEFGEIGGFYSRIDYRISRFINKRATFGYAEIGIDNGYYQGAANKLNISNDHFGFSRLGGGFANGIQITRNLEFRYYFGFGLEMAHNNDFQEDYVVDVTYFKFGSNLSISLLPNFQIIGGYGMYNFIRKAKDSNDNYFGKWSNLFENRSGPSSFIGIKFVF